MTIEYTLKSDPVEAYLASYNNEIDYFPLSRDEAIDLGATPEDIEAADKGYTVACKTIAIDYIYALRDRLGDD